jgi:cytosine/creatinine deaminase
MAIVLNRQGDSMDNFMLEAISEANKGLDEGGIPIGSVLVKDNQIVGRGHNKRVQKGSAILHAEMDALESAGCQPASFYEDSIIYTTLSPCSMCTGAILLYQIRHVVIGENKTFLGDEELLKERGVKVEVLSDQTCVQLMQDFIFKNRSLWSEDIGTSLTC